MFWSAFAIGIVCGPILTAAGEWLRTDSDIHVLGKLLGSILTFPGVLYTAFTGRDPFHSLSAMCVYFLVQIIYFTAIVFLWHTTVRFFSREHGLESPHASPLRNSTPATFSEDSGVTVADREIDARGMHRPLPILRAKTAIESLASGKILKVVADDPNSVQDFREYAEQNGHRLLDSHEDNGEYIFILQKA